MLSFPSIVGLAVTGSVAFIIWKAYPKPIPGIPYHKKSARSLLGDIPRLSKSLKKTQDFMKYIADEAESFQAPIFQLFLSPFSAPLVVVVDYEETRDIMMHRTGEFDRSDRLIEIFQPVIGTNQFALKSGDVWKLHRRLVQDTMSPAFLRDVAAPSLYKAFQVLVDLWERKIELASGKPFPIGADISAATLDGVLAFTFGSDLPNTATQPRLEALKSLDREGFIELLHQDASVDFPVNDLDPSVASLSEISHYLAKIAAFPLPSVAWSYFKRTSHFQQQDKSKRAFIRSEIEKSLQARVDKPEDSTVLRNAVDLVIDRERRLSERYGKTPDYFSDAVIDELFGFVLAGHETTSSTMAWTMKILTSYPSIQLKLRQLLYESYPDAAAENRSPTLEELLSTSIPYLDGFMHESLRRWPVAPLNDRVAVQETTVLGHVIPKNTTVAFFLGGPSFTSKGYQINESNRTETWKKDKEAGINSVGTDDLDEFKPERWLKDMGGSKEPVLDAQAWPLATFGMGPRGCFGRRLAMIEFRFLLTFLVWNFEYLSLPEELDTWEGVVSAVHSPRKCYIRARKVSPSAYNLN